VCLKSQARRYSVYQQFAPTPNHFTGVITMNLAVRAPGGDLNLQATLSLSSATGPDEPIVKPHHPITCSSPLRYDEDGTFSCGHVTVPPGDHRTQSCLHHTVALLLMELVQDL